MIETLLVAGFIVLSLIVVFAVMALVNRLKKPAQDKRIEGLRLLAQENNWRFSTELNDRKAVIEGIFDDYTIRCDQEEGVFVDLKHTFKQPFTIKDFVAGPDSKIEEIIRSRTPLQVFFSKWASSLAWFEALERRLGCRFRAGGSSIKSDQRTMSADQIAMILPDLVRLAQQLDQKSG